RDWSSDVCSSDLTVGDHGIHGNHAALVLITQLQVQVGGTQRQGAQLHNRCRCARGTPGPATSGTVGICHLDITQDQRDIVRQGDADIQRRAVGTVVTGVDIDVNATAAQLLLHTADDDGTRVCRTSKTVGIVDNDVSFNIVAKTDGDTVLTGYARQRCIIQSFHGKTGNRQ